MLLGGDARSRMEAVSTLADEIRHDRPETASWHFVNTEVSSHGCDAKRGRPDGARVVAQFEKDTRVIADRQLATPIRVEALEARITPPEARAWSQGMPPSWANESFEIAKRDIYGQLEGTGATAAPLVLPRDYAAR